MEKIRVLIIGNHVLCREGLRLILARQKSLEVVGDVGSDLEMIKKAVKLKPDIVLFIEHKKIDINCYKVISAILKSRPESKIIILTDSEDDDDLFASIRVGIRGYLPKNINSEHLIISIQQVAKGGFAVSGDITEKVFAEFRDMPSNRQHKDSVKELLSSREKETLFHIARGKSNKEIASILNIADTTVKIHVKNILKKLNLGNRVQAAIYVMEQGLLPQQKSIPTKEFHN
jgi:two-component system nitrate/nitrite response regulator NarL